MSLIYEHSFFNYSENDRESGVTTKISIIMDWGDLSSDALKKVLEVKKELLIDYLIDVDVESTYININSGAFVLSEEIPSIYVNGRLLATGRSPSREEIIKAVLETEEVAPKTSRYLLVHARDNDPPLNSAMLAQIEA